MNVFARSAQKCQWSFPQRQSRDLARRRGRWDLVMLLLPEERPAQNYSVASIEDSVMGTILKVLVQKPECMGHMCVYCAPCCDAVDWTLELTGEKTFHIDLERVIDQRVASSYAVSSESHRVQFKKKKKTSLTAWTHHGDTEIDATCSPNFQWPLMRMSRTALWRRDAEARIPGDVVQCAGPQNHLVLQWKHILEVAGTLCVICSLDQTVFKQTCCTTI